MKKKTKKNAVKSITDILNPKWDMQSCKHKAAALCTLTYGCGIKHPLNRGISIRRAGGRMIDELCQVLYQPFKLSPSAANSLAGGQTSAHSWARGSRGRWWWDHRRVTKGETKTLMRFYTSCPFRWTHTCSSRPALINLFWISCHLSFVPPPSFVRPPSCTPSHSNGVFSYRCLSNPNTADG